MLAKAQLTSALQLPVEKKDRYIDLGMTAVRYSSEAVEDYFYLDVLPWCSFFPSFLLNLLIYLSELVKYIPAWVPFVKFPRIAKEARKVSRAMRFELHELTKKRIVRGDLFLVKRVCRLMHFTAVRQRALRGKV